MTRLLKRWLKADGVRRVLCWFGAQYIRFVYLTSRWELIGDEPVRALWDQHQPFIAAFWHNRILMMPCIWRRGVPIHMLISQHRDGLLIARTVAHFGIDTIAGSSSRGGSAALRTMLKKLKNGEYVGITPDGPRGPRMRASDGIVQVARLAGVPIVPCGFSVRRRRVLNSWDKFIIALPFTRGVLIWGEPVMVPSHITSDEQERLRCAVENGLSAIMAEADRRVGHLPIEPDTIEAP